MYDSRIARFFAVDPLASKYPELSPYHFTGNNPIRFVDFDGQDFGIKINHKEKTIVVVANVYTTSEKSYKQALKSAGLWNTKTATVDGYVVTFQINVQKPVSVTQEEVLRFKPSLVRKNGKIKKYKYQITRNKLASYKAYGKSVADDIGNVYAGNKGYYSQKVSGSSYVGGTTAGARYVSMNTHDIEGDMGENEELVAHEFGHLMGLDDVGGTYYSSGGIMEYNGTDLKPISDNDVKNILNYAKDYLSSPKSTGAKVTLMENIGKSDGSNPIGVKGESKDEK